MSKAAQWSIGWTGARQGLLSIAIATLAACGGGGGDTAEVASGSGDGGIAGVTPAPGGGTGGTGGGGTGGGGTGGGGTGGGGTGGSTDTGGGGTGGSGPETLLPPDAVTGVAASVDARTTIRLSWPGTPRATGYDLYWSALPGVDLTTANRIDNVSPPFVHQGLEGGRAYHYVIVAENSAGSSTPSVEVSAILPPVAPDSVTVSPGDGTISLVWSASPGAFAYRVWWSNAPGVTQDGSEFIELVTPSLVHTDLTNGIAYYYIVTAIGAGGEGLPSSPVSGMPVTPLPTSPRTISAMVNPAENRSVILSWAAPEVPTDPAEILAYRVYRSISPGISAGATDVTMIAEPASPAFTDSVPINGISYYYVVTAVTMSGEGETSAEVSAKPEESGTGDDDGSGGVPGGVFDCGEPTHCWQLRNGTATN